MKPLSVVLVVDDLPPIRMLARRYFEPAGAALEQQAAASAMP